jgi:hypothetical protein
MVAYILDPSYAGGIGRTIEAQGWPMVKSMSLYLKNN